MPQTLSVLHKLKKIVPIIYQYLCSKHWNKYLGHESTRGTSTTNRRLDVDENQKWAWFGHEVGFCDAVSIPWVSALLPLPHGVKKQTYKKKVFGYKKYLDIFVQVSCQRSLFMTTELAVQQTSTSVSIGLYICHPGLLTKSMSQLTSISDILGSSSSSSAFSPHAQR